MSAIVDKNMNKKDKKIGQPASQSGYKRQKPRNNETERKSRLQQAVNLLEENGFPVLAAGLSSRIELQRDPAWDAMCVTLQVLTKKPG